MTIRNTALSTLWLCLAALGTAEAQQTPTPGEFSLQRGASGLELSVGAKAPFRVTANAVENQRLVDVPDSEVVIALWEERASNGQTTPWYGISRDGGQSFVSVTRTSYEIGMDRAGRFDPLQKLPDFFSNSLLPNNGSVYFVQYHTRALAEYQEQVEALGAKIHGHVTNHANLVRMSPATRAQVAALPFVRWVGPYHNEFRLEQYLLERLETGALSGTQPYNVWVFDRDVGDQAAVKAKIEAIGGVVREYNPKSSLLGAMLTEPQLAAVASMEEVQHIDRHSELEPDLDIVRQFSGTNYLETMTGFTGVDVRGEIADTGVLTTHQEFQHHGGVTMHGGQSGSQSHGTSVYGIVFGDGTGNAAARGLLPDGGGIFADTGFNSWLNNTTPTSRAAMAAELVDPGDIYRGLFQTNSTGSTRTALYTTISANMDQIVLDNDLVILQSQSNAGSTQSRPEAWGKNMMGIGGINHEGTLTRADDNWSFSGSIGPATDGRIKPDMAHFYDGILTASSSGGFTTSFGGTSGATPCTAGHFGLFFQMWHNDVFDNDPTGATPFFSKPHFETAKAAMINTAEPWDFSGATHDLTRVHQGFGAANVQYMYDMRDKTVWRNREMIDALETISIPVNVAPGEAKLKVTMVYRDLPGIVGAAQHRINAIALRVTAPGGTTYTGNSGLLVGNVSTPSDIFNEVDTVENVWIDNPAAGSWNVEIVGLDINTDLYPGVGGNNADYSLWVTGATESCTAPIVYCTAQVNSQGCTPAIATTNSPSIAAGDFSVDASNILNNKQGILFWGLAADAQPFAGGTKCVANPVRRTPLQTSGGNAVGVDCSGNFSYTFTTSYLNSKGLTAGQTIYAQYWSRDNVQTATTNLTDAVEFTLCE